MRNQLNRYGSQAVSLISLPTPLEPMLRLSERLGGPRIWIKRDDCTTLGGGGNKSRKLEFLMAAALKEGADVVITTGALQSNHCRQTAAAAARLGLGCVLVLIESVSGRSASYNASGNVLLSGLFGAELRRFPAGTDGLSVMNEAADELRSRGLRPYVVPMGGSNAVGAAAYAHAINELQTQTADANARIGSIVVATGSCGTHAGLLCGTIMNNLDVTVQGMSITKLEPELSPLVHALTIETLKEFGASPDVPEGSVRIDDRFIGEGYGQPTESMIDAVKLVARCEGLLLDPVYSGKAMAGLIRLVRDGAFERDADVVFWHTGGSVGLFAYDDVFNLDALGPVVVDGPAQRSRELDHAGMR